MILFSVCLLTLAWHYREETVTTEEREHPHYSTRTLARMLLVLTVLISGWIWYLWLAASGHSVRAGKRGDAQLKAETMRNLWVPGVNNLGRFGRWTFAEFTAVFEIEARFNELIEQLRAGVPALVAA